MVCNVSVLRFRSPVSAYHAVAIAWLTLHVSAPAAMSADQDNGAPALNANCTEMDKGERAFIIERHEQCLATYGSQGGSVRPRSGKNCVYGACEQFHGCGAADNAGAEESPISSMLHSTDEIAHKLQQLPATKLCARAVDDYSSCSAFVSEALYRLYGITDFKKDITSRSFPDHVANDISNYVETHSRDWQRVGSADIQHALSEAQRLANEGYAVIAIHSRVPQGHVALIIPGELRPSATWGLQVPNSASMFFGKPDKTYIGGMLSKAWQSQDKGRVRIYYRAKP